MFTGCVELVLRPTVTFFVTLLSSSLPRHTSALRTTLWANDTVDRRSWGTCKSPLYYFEYVERTRITKLQKVQYSKVIMSKREKSSRKIDAVVRED